MCEALRKASSRLGTDPRCWWRGGCKKNWENLQVNCRPLVHVLLFRRGGARRCVEGPAVRIPRFARHGTEEPPYNYKYKYTGKRGL